MKNRGRTHTTLTETAKEVVNVLSSLPGIKMIAPGEIKKGGKRLGGSKYITVVYTQTGFYLLITGQSVQRVAVHTDKPKRVRFLVSAMKQHKSLKGFLWRERKLTLE